jgi:toluene monooxygenase system ferredoxin subunit
MSMIDTLKSSALFGGLDKDHLERVSVLCRGWSYREGKMVFNEGDEAAELYLLTNGRVALEMLRQVLPNRPAIPSAVVVVTKGECFGLPALVEPYIYTLSARCMTPCTVLAIKGDMLRRVMDADVGLGYEVMKRLTRLILSRLQEEKN